RLVRRVVAVPADVGGDPHEPREGDREDRGNDDERPARWGQRRLSRCHPGSRGLTGESSLTLFHSLCSSSPLVNVQVRVMYRMSVSRRISAGNAANGAAISRIFTADAIGTL